MKGETVIAARQAICGAKLALLVGLSLAFGGLSGRATAEVQHVVMDLKTADPAHYLDRWVYPFNVTPGTRIQSPLFGELGSSGFDERDGQYLLAIDTTSLGIPSGLDPSQYNITSLQLRVVDSVGGYELDVDYDSFRTYLDSSSEKYLSDEDVGRPVELYAAGLRGGYTEFGFPDGGANTAAPIFSAGSPFGPTDRGTRNVFAANALGDDVSNNVNWLGAGANGFESSPLAVAHALRGDVPLEDGAKVAAGDVLVFDVEISNTDTLGYVQRQLSAGQLGLVLSSLHPTELFGGTPLPSIVTANHFALPAPVLTISYELRELLIGGDLDSDRDVDTADLLMFLGNWTGSDYVGPPMAFSDGDLDEDGDVDSADLLSFLAAWTGALSTAEIKSMRPVATATEIVAVPEPTSGSCVMACALGAWWAHRRRQLTFARGPAGQGR